MRTLPSEVADVVTRPTYLVELGFAPPIRLSTGPTVSWGGYSWFAAPVDVGSVDINSHGDLQVSVSLNNLDRTYGVLVLNQGTRGRSCRIWGLYGDPATNAPILFAEGVMDGARVEDTVDLNIVGQSSLYGGTPRVLCLPPLFNHMPPDGTEIRWGATLITITSR